MVLPSWPYPRWIAHRGAFRGGAAHGYRAFECDVKLSADGVPFLLHDATLQRTTSGRGAAAALPWSELSRLHAGGVARRALSGGPRGSERSRLDPGGWHSRAYAGEPLASFGAVASFCLRNAFALNVEIKP